VRRSATPPCAEHHDEYWFQFVLGSAQFCAIAGAAIATQPMTANTLNLANRTWRAPKLEPTRSVVWSVDSFQSRILARLAGEWNYRSRLERSNLPNIEDSRQRADGERQFVRHRKIGAARD